MDNIEAKALALVNKIFAEVGGSPIDYDALVGAGDVVTLALCRAIEQHEAFRREVSDAIVIYSPENRNPALGRFIITEPDPLVEALDNLGLRKADEWAGDIRKALAARGFEIREKGQ